MFNLIGRLVVGVFIASLCAGTSGSGNSGFTGLLFWIVLIGFMIMTNGGKKPAAVSTGAPVSGGAGTSWWPILGIGLAVLGVVWVSFATVGLAGAFAHADLFKLAQLANGGCPHAAAH